jgi:glycerol-3-phosphate cytidylyltransferase-like family protein
MICSCATQKSIKYVDREVIKYQKEFVHDTLVQHTHDSVYHTVFQKGDTVYNTKYVEKTRWKDKVVYRTDTCYQDSIRTIIKESVKEKQITPKWCYYLLVFSIIVIIFAIVKVIRWVQIR